MTPANYIELVGSYFPDVQVSTTGDPTVYNDLVWVSTVVSQAELDAAHLAECKTNKIIEFSEIARDEIVNGFPSSALGTPHLYDSEPEDQLNLIGSVTAGVTMPYSCKPYTQGYQVINLGGAKVGTDATGYANNATTYSCEIQVDGSSAFCSYTGQDAQTIDQLIAQLNADVDFTILATASLENGNIKITSKSYGATSTVNIVVGSLLTNITGYVGVDAAIDGMDGVDNIKEYKMHTHENLLQVLNDGKDVKLTVLQKFNVKKEQIMLAPDMVSCEAITWD